jgi:D-amino-acid dehydrogenase
MSGSRGDITPRSAVVVGAGIVGLSTAWFLQDRGVHVTVVDRDEVGAGASWGNAGYLSPALAMPLTSPHVLGEGLRGLADRRAPLSIPARWDPRLWGFLLRFAAHCRAGYWRRALQYHLPLLEECLPAFDTLASDGVDAGGEDAPVVAGLETARAAGEMVRELTLLRRLGVPVEFEQLDRGDVVALRPQPSERVAAGVRIDGQRFLDPGRFLDRLAQALVRRGATIRRRFAVTRIVSDLDRVSAYPDEGPPVTAEVAVVATGARLDDLVRPRGVRVRVRAGRGYSFSVPTDIPVTGPLYLPGVRVACTPYRDRLGSRARWSSGIPTNRWTSGGSMPSSTPSGPCWPASGGTSAAPPGSGPDRSPRMRSRSSAPPGSVASSPPVATACGV